MENSLKLTIVGAGSPYTPELLEQAKNYEDRLPIREIVLYDIDLTVWRLWKHFAIVLQKN